MRKKPYVGTRISRSLLLHDLLAIENKILFLKLATAFNLNFNAKKNIDQNLTCEIFDSQTYSLHACFKSFVSYTLDE